MIIIYIYVDKNPRVSILINVSFPETRSLNHKIETTNPLARDGMICSV